MTPTSPENVARRTEPGRRESLLRRVRAPEFEELPALPEDCQPEFELQPTPAAVQPVEVPTPKARGSRDSFERLLRSLVGKTVTVIDPESYEEAPVGHRIQAAIYKAQLLGVGDDYITLASQFVHRGPGAVNGSKRETIRHYVPLDRIKRVSLLAKQAMIHL